MDKIKIMIVDDIKEFTDYFESSLKNYDDIELLATVSSGSQAVQKAIELKPDVILMDIQMENGYAGILASKEILCALPETKIIALTVHESSELVCQAFKAGMIDYLLKTSSINEIVITIRDCMNTDSYKKINSILAYDFSKLKSNQKKIMKCFALLSKISKSEADVLMSLCSGMSYKDIAKQRYVEEVSVRSLANRIIKKTGFRYIKDIINQFNECDFFNSVYNDDE